MSISLCLAIAASAAVSNLNPTTTSISPDVVKQFAPVVYFHPNEKYFPCSIEYLLTNSTLKDRANPSWSQPNPTQATLAQYNAANYYVAIKESQFGGQGSSAPLYYAVQQYQDVVEISYLMLYAYQGGQTCRALRSGTEFDCIVKTLGIHQGDLERVTVTLLPQANGTYRALRVGYEAHGELSYSYAQQVQWENGTHPVVNSALNGHSSRNMHRVGEQVVEWQQAGVVAITSKLGTSNAWKPYESSSLKQIGLDSLKNPIGDQVWAKFAGRLGDGQNNSLSSATYLDGSNLSGLNWAYVKLVDFAAKLKNTYEDDVLHGNGPNGPASRDWVNASPIKSKQLENLVVLNQTDNIGGSESVTWLTGTFDGGGETQAMQVWNNGGKLAMSRFGRDDKGGIQVLGATQSDIGGINAVTWLTGDFDGNGKTQVMQVWNNGGQLAMSRLGSDGKGGMKVLGATQSDIGGINAVTWLTGDFDGNGKTQVMQVWNNGGQLAMSRLGSDGKGGMKVLGATQSDIGGINAVTWLTGDFDGNGKTQVMQVWNNGGQLAMSRLGSDGKGGMKVLGATQSDIGGINAVTWLTGDFDGNGDGKTEVVQAWNNNNQLALSSFKSDGKGGMQLLAAKPSLQEGTGAVTWLVGNFEGDARPEIIQIWKNGGALGMVMYGTL